MINPTNNQLIRDLIHDNNVYFQKIDHEKEYIKSLMSQLEPTLVQCGVAMANDQKATATITLTKTAEICSKVAISYEAIHLWRNDIKKNLEEIDRLRGANNGETK